jgi:hypothetical protein
MNNHRREAQKNARKVGCHITAISQSCYSASVNCIYSFQHVFPGRRSTKRPRGHGLQRLEPPGVRQRRCKQFVAGTFSSQLSTALMMSVCARPNLSPPGSTCNALRAAEILWGPLRLSPPTSADRRARSKDYSRFGVDSRGEGAERRRKARHTIIHQALEY